MTQYQVQISMTAATVTALTESGSRLQAFRAVQSSDRAGRPLLWRSPDYSATTYVDWTSRYFAYTSRSAIKAGQRVVVGFQAVIDTGQTLNVTSGGIGEVSAEGRAGEISILNTTTTQFTCGIGGPADNPEPTCAFPLYGNHLQRIVPLPKILLMFSTQPLVPGTVISGTIMTTLTSFGPAVLVDLGSESDRAVSYDINTGWSWGGFSWARQIPAGTDLVPLLIESPVAALQV
jgi:hypothetical protein